jgi:hypothetical protein
MRSCATSFLTMAVVLVSPGLWAQERYHSVDPDLLARLSYDNSAIVRGDEVRQVCVAVSRDGDYRIVRSLTTGEAQRLQGKLPQEQFEQLKKLLGSDKFRALSGNHGGLIRQASESFGAEIPVPPRKLARGFDIGSAVPPAQRFQWVNADGESPFPGPAAKVVDWLKHFEPKDGKSFVYADYPDVCPSGGLRLLQPSVAANDHP